MDLRQINQAFDVTTTAITTGIALLVSIAAFVVMRLYLRSILREQRPPDFDVRQALNPPAPAAAPPVRNGGPGVVTQVIRNLNIQIIRPTHARMRTPTFKYAAAAFRRAAYVYAVAGSLQVAVSVSLLFISGTYSLPPTPSRLAVVVWSLSIFWAWSAFTFVALALYLGPDRRPRTLLVCGYVLTLVGMGLLLELAGTPTLRVVDAGLSESDRTKVTVLAQVIITAVHNPTTPEALIFPPHLQPIVFCALSGIPVLFPFLAYNRWVRGTVGPLFSILALMITVLAVVIIDVSVHTSPGVWLIVQLRRAFGDNAFAALLTLSFTASVVLAWLGLLKIGDRYRHGRLSDQTFLLDTLWLSVALFVMTYLMGDKRPFFFVLGLVPFVLYKLAVGRALARLRRRAECLREAQLLFLRVFGSSHRTEKLFDLLAARWRYAGRIQLISSTDIARGRFEPDEFLDFLNGRLARSFISTERDLQERLAALESPRDPDGRYRISEFFCRVDMWQSTVTRLMEQADLVVMDLRGFTSQSEGCIFEMSVILNKVPLQRVVLVIDKSTDMPFLRETLETLWKQVTIDSPNIAGNAPVRMIDLVGGYRSAVRQLMEIGDERQVAA